MTIVGLPLLCGWRQARHFEKGQVQMSKQNITDEGRMTTRENGKEP